MNQFRMRVLVALAAVFAVTMAVAQSISGTYAGYSSYYRSEVQMRFNGSRVDVRIVPRNGTVKYQRGSYSEDSGTLTIDGVVFMIRRNGDSIRVRESKNSLNSYDLVRKNLGNVDWGAGWGGSGDSGWGNVGDGGSDNDGIGQRPPSWMTGEFNGYNRLYDSDINLTVSTNGSVTARIRSHNGQRTTQYGVYRDGRFSLGGTWFEAARTDDGIRTYQVNDRNNWMEYRRTSGGNWGGSGGSGGIGDTRPPDAPPAWARGTFEGYNKLYQATIDLTIDSRGYLKARIAYRDGRRVNQDGWYRGGKMVVGGTTFTCTRVGDGFRLVQVGDEDNSTSYRRIR